MHEVKQLGFWDTLSRPIESKFLEVKEITDPDILALYSPIEEYRLRDILSRKYKTDSYSTEVNNAVEKTRKTFVDYIENNIRKDTAVFFPLYSSLDAYGEDEHDKHYDTFRTIVSSLKNLEGETPRIVCISDTKLLSRKEARIGKDGKRFKVNRTEEFVKVPDMELIAWSFRNWLDEHPEVTNVVVSDMVLLTRMFPGYKFPGNFSDCAYRVFCVDPEDGFMLRVREKKVYRISVIATHSKHRKYSDLVYSVTADMLSILMNPADKPVAPGRYRIIRSRKEIAAIINHAVSTGTALSLDIETTGINPVINGQRIISAAISDGNTAWGFLVDHPLYRIKGFTPEDGYGCLRDIISRKDLILVLQNGVYDLKWLVHFLGIYPESKIRDTMLLDHWLFETQGSISKKMGLGYGYGMDNQIPRYLRVPSHKPLIERYKKAAKVLNPKPFPSGKALAELSVVEMEKFVLQLNSDDWIEPNSGTYAQFPFRVLLKYNMKDAFFTHRIFMKQVRLIKEECGGKVPKIFTYNMPINIKNAVYMELNGIEIDYDLLKDKIIECTAEMKKSKDAVLSGTKGITDKFNIDSEAEIKEILIKYYGCTEDDFYDPVFDKITMQNHVIKRIADQYDLEFLRDFLDYKKYSKARNTYFLPFLFHSYKGRLYYNINVTGTVTGRFSSDNPNVQNIPKAIPVRKGKIFVKEVLRADKGCKLIDLDLASAEVKVLTTVCPDPTLIGVLKDGLDAHCYTASLILGVPYDAVNTAKVKEDDKELRKTLTKTELGYLAMRQKAKRTNFGAIYRIGPLGLAAQLNIADDLGDINPRTGSNYTWTERCIDLKAKGMKEADGLLKKLFNEVFPTLVETFENVDRMVFEKHYIESIFNRRKRCTYTPIPMIYRILKMSDLYIDGGDGRGEQLSLSEALRLIVSKRPFRQSMNFGVQSSTSEYMQLFIAYIIREAAARKLKIKVHLTVHDSVLFSFSGTEEDTATFISICDDGMKGYLMEQSDKLPIPIGYSVDFSEHYCAKSTNVT